MTAVVDTNKERAAEIAGASGTTALTDYRDLLGQVDGVVVAVPTELHAEIAVPFLERGTPVLVEKPMSRTLADADRMIAAAAAGGAVLAVGHTERHNPAVAIALRLVTSPRFIEVHRLSAFPDRSLDIDVVFDLMIHDLDVILAIVGPDVVSIEAVGVPVLTEKYDIANVRLRFASGCIANITASRISKDRGAEDQVLPAGCVSLRRLRVPGSRRIPADPEGTAAGHPGRHHSVERAAPGASSPISSGDSRGGAPLVDGAAGRRALMLASQIAERMETVG